MAITGTDKAYTFARSGIARSGATRSNYVPPWTSVDLIVRDGAGNIVSRTDLTMYIRQDSLQISQALNDEPDTCSFQIVPTAPPSAVPQVGQEIVVTWTPGGDALFHGYALVLQFDRRPKNESPWVSVQCQDSMWRFDARIVTYRFPAQSVTASIQFLVTWFCNDPEAPSPVDFTTTFVQPNMPGLPAFDVINQRPLTVMRRLLAAVGGAFYLDGRDVHAWAGSLSEPNQTNPQPLTNYLESLKTFRLTQDATQLRKRVLVEGKRASTLIRYPDVGENIANPGIPVTDGSIFPPGNLPYEGAVARIGSQWMFVNNPVVVAPTGENPPQTRVATPFTPGINASLYLEPMAVSPPPWAWLRVGGQFTMYAQIFGDPVAGVWHIEPFALYPYGVLTAPIPAGEAVEWVDGVTVMAAHGLSWTHPAGQTSPGDGAIRAQPSDTPVVTLAEADRPLDGWPPIEGFVQDGRYSYEGALARANADLDSFAEPLITAEWETDDLNAQPGRHQVIALTGTSVIDPVNLTLTITQVDLSFPLRTQPPRRRCVAGDVKPTTFLDLVLTDQS
jgi:hypothetical protein